MDDKKNVFTEEQKAKRRQQQNEDRQHCFALAEAQALQMFSYGSDPSAVQKFIELTSTFRQLDVRNVLLLMAQCPNARQIGTYREWSDKQVRFKKGEHAFLLLIQGDEYTRKDGGKGRYYNVVKYFDVSQTTAKYVPTANPPTYSQQKLLEALYACAGSTPIEAYNADTDDLPENAAGLYYPERSVIIMKKDLPFNVFFMELAKNIALARLDNGGTFFVPDYEFDATCIAYLVCAKWNVDTNTFIFPRVPDGYKEFDGKELQSKLYNWKRTADEMGKVIYSHLEKAIKENSISGRGER